MTKPIFFFFTFLIITTTTSSSNPNTTTTNQSPTTAHSVLTHHGFPIGLLPTDVHSYNLNHSSHHFSVHLTSPCRLILPPDNYLATYSKTLTGNIVHDRITDLNGIKVKAFFQWWAITGIKISGDHLVFEVGMVTVKYPVKNFYEVPQCEGRNKNKNIKHSSS